MATGEAEVFIWKIIYFISWSIWQICPCCLKMCFLVWYFSKFSGFISLTCASSLSSTMRCRTASTLKCTNRYACLSVSSTSSCLSLFLLLCSTSLSKGVLWYLLCTCWHVLCLCGLTDAVYLCLFVCVFFFFVYIECLCVCVFVCLFVIDGALSPFPQLGLAGWAQRHNEWLCRLIGAV